MAKILQGQKILQKMAATRVARRLDLPCIPCSFCHSAIPDRHSEELRATKKWENFIFLHGYCQKICSGENLFS